VREREHVRRGAGEFRHRASCPRGIRIYDLVIPDHPGADPSSVTDEQLARWAAEPVGAQRVIDDALREVRRALSRLEVDYGELELFVQGGYANRTAVSVQADIDIVVRWLALPVSEIIEDPEDSTALAYRGFRDAVLGVLRSQLDPGVRDPRIACRCELATGNVDVVPCLPFSLGASPSATTSGYGPMRTTASRSCPGQG
jgi:hypothetical protein